METHPSYRVLSSVLLKYPKAAGSLFQTYNDLLLAQQWTDIEVLDLGQGCPRGALKGCRPTSNSSPSGDPLCIVPCFLSEPLSLSFLQNVFSSLSDPLEIYLAINSEDSSIVYYKISSGIVKPAI